MGPRPHAAYRSVVIANVSHLHVFLLQISQYVFEETFNLRFAVPFTQHNATVSGATLAALSPAQVAQIRRLNSLDLELYEFAKNLMFKRLVILTERPFRHGS